MASNGNAVRMSAWDSEHKSSTFRRNLMHRPQNGSDKESTGSKLRGHFVAASGEFVGTFLFLFFAFAWHQTAATQANPVDAVKNGYTSAETVMFISIGYGFSLLVSAWSFYRISGGLFNPAVVLGMVLTGSLPAVRGLFLFPAEIIGAIAASAVVSGLFPNDIATVNTTLSANTSVVRGVFIGWFLLIHEVSILC